MSLSQYRLTPRMSPTGVPVAGPELSRRAIYPATVMALVPGDVHPWTRLIETGCVFKRPESLDTELFVGPLKVNQLTGAKTGELPQLAPYTVRDLVRPVSPLQVWALTSDGKLWSINPDGSTAWSVTIASYVDHPLNRLVMPLTAGMFAMDDYVYVNRGAAGCASRYNKTDGSLAQDGPIVLYDSADLSGNWYGVGPSQAHFGSGTFGQLFLMDRPSMDAGVIYSITGSGMSSLDLNGIAVPNPGSGRFYVCGPGGVYRLQSSGPGFSTTWHNTTIPATGLRAAINPAGTGYDLYVIGHRTNAWTGSGGAYATVWRFDESGNILWAYDTAGGSGDGEPVRIYAQAIDGVRRVWITTYETAEYEFVS